jgi:hypothetical protein
MFTELSGTGIDICRAKGTGEAKAQTCQPERSVGLAGRERSDHTVRQDERMGSLTRYAHLEPVYRQALKKIKPSNTGSIIIDR